MRTAMIDTMVFDVLGDDPRARDAVLAAIAGGRLRLVTTHVQERQLADIRDAGRRKRLQRLPREVIATAAPVVAVARTGRPILGSSAETRAVSVGPRHAADELIAQAATARADVLVTEDRRLADDARRRGVVVWRTSQLVDWAQGSRERERAEP